MLFQAPPLSKDGGSGGRTCLQNGQASNSYSSIGWAGRFLKLDSLPLTKAPEPRRSSACAPAVATCACGSSSAGSLLHGCEHQLGCIH